MKKLSQWIIFIKERFDPLSHLLMIFVFLIVHIFLAHKLNQTSIPWYQFMLLYTAVTLFYFKLRLYDEVKDYQLDVVINKSRPLPRGLLNHNDMYYGMAFCILGELAIFYLNGANSFFSILIAIFYSLLMYKEFFISKIIRPHLTTYALTHTIVTSLLSLAIFSFLTQKTFLAILQNKYYLIFSLTNWMLFNIFEFGRKTFATSEERDQVDTYSSIFGRIGAVILVQSQIILSIILIWQIPIINNLFTHISSIVLALITTIISLNYIFKNETKSAKQFRIISSAYIVLFYLILIIGYYIGQI